MSVEVRPRQRPVRDIGSESATPFNFLSALPDNIVIQDSQLTAAALAEILFTAANTSEPGSVLDAYQGTSRAARLTQHGILQHECELWGVPDEIAKVALDTLANTWNISPASN